MRKNMLYIFDFDHTIFDTDKFRRDMARAFGVSKKIYEASSFEYFHERNTPYNAYKHLSELKRMDLIENAGSARDNLVDMLANPDKYLFSGAESMLRSLKKKGNKSILLTFGDLIWQKSKVKNLKIKKYFDRIIVTDKKKRDVIGFVKEYEGKIMVINDNTEETMDMKKVLGSRMDYYIIKGPHNSLKNKKIKIYSFKELIKKLK